MLCGSVDSHIERLVFGTFARSIQPRSYWDYPKCYKVVLFARRSPFLESIYHSIMQRFQIELSRYDEPIGNIMFGQYNIFCLFRISDCPVVLTRI